MVDFGIKETLETDVEDVWRGTESRSHLVPTGFVFAMPFH